MMRMTRLRRAHWIPCLATLLTLVVIGATPAVSAAPAITKKAEVKIDNFTFSPAVITVKSGTQITWTNADDIPHTVVSDSKAFKSKVLATGERFTMTAGKTGTYPYSCSIHPNMTGKVVVE
jgi:plastocyanin